MGLAPPRTVLALLALSVLLVGSASVEASAGRTAAPSARLGSLERSVLDEINAVRRSNGLAPLRASRPLAEAAATHSEAMAGAGFFSHSSADGTAFWKRVQRFYRARGFGHWSVGENLLWASPSVDPAQAVQMWLDSPPHRRNMLTATWREVGLAAVSVDAAPGIFGGRAVTVITADFGVRR